MSRFSRFIAALIGTAAVGTTAVAWTLPASAEMLPPAPSSAPVVGITAPAPSTPFVWPDGSVTTSVVFACVGNAELPLGSGVYLNCSDGNYTSFSADMSQNHGVGNLVVNDGVNNFAAVNSYEGSIETSGAITTAPAMPFGLDYFNRSFVIGCTKTIYAPTEWDAQHVTIECQFGSIPGLPNGSVVITRYMESLSGTLAVENIGTLWATARVIEMFVGPWAPPVIATFVSGNFIPWRPLSYDPTAPIKGEIGLIDSIAAEDPLADLPVDAYGV